MKEPQENCRCCAYIQLPTAETISVCLEPQGAQRSQWLLHPSWSVMTAAFVVMGIRCAALGFPQCGAQPVRARLLHLGQPVWHEYCKVSTVTAALAVISLKSRCMIRWAYTAFSLAFSCSFLYVAVNLRVVDEFIWCILTLMIYFPTSS